MNSPLRTERQNWFTPFRQSDLTRRVLYFCVTLLPPFGKIYSSAVEASRQSSRQKLLTKIWPYLYYFLFVFLVEGVVCMLQFGVPAITVLAKLQPVCKETEVWLSSGGGGGGGVLFSSLDGIFGEFSSIHSPPAFFFF